MAKHWNPYGGLALATGGYSGAWERQPATTTLASLRQPGKYWVVSDAQLKRDLAGRTLKDVYRDNHAGRIRDMAVDGNGQVMGVYYSLPFGKYEPRTMDGPSIAHGPRMGCQTLLQEYLVDCYARGHEPHPASIDSDHPRNCHREKMPKREVVQDYSAVDGIVRAMARGAGLTDDILSAGQSLLDRIDSMTSVEFSREAARIGA